MVKLNEKYTEFPHGPYPHTSTQAQPLMITTSARVDTGCNQWAWIAISSSRIIAIVYTTVHSLCFIFMCFHKCVYVSIMVVSQKNFTLIFLCIVSENSLFTRIYHYFRLLRWLKRKESACQYRRCGFAPGKSLGEGKGSPLQCSCLENPLDRGAWWATVHGVTKSLTQLSY